jgi:hypothetical protein
LLYAQQVAIKSDAPALNTLAVGVRGLTGGIFGSISTTATTAEINLTHQPIHVRQAYAPSPAAITLAGPTSIANPGTKAVLDVVDRRIMVWPVAPTESAAKLRAASPISPAS